MAACSTKTDESPLVATASVLSMERRDAGCALFLRPPEGEVITFEVADEPDGDAARMVELSSGRVLAVKVTVAAGALTSSALVTSAQGPSRVSVSIGAALALCERGVHTVVVTDGSSAS